MKKHEKSYPSLHSIPLISKPSDTVDLVEVSSVVSDVLFLDIKIFILAELDSIFRFAISKRPSLVSANPDVGNKRSHIFMQTEGVAGILVSKPALFIAIEQYGGTDIVLPILPKDHRAIAVDL